MLVDRSPEMRRAPPTASFAHNDDSVVMTLPFPMLPFFVAVRAPPRSARPIRAGLRHHGRVADWLLRGPLCLRHVLRPHVRIILGPARQLPCIHSRAQWGRAADVYGRRGAGGSTLLLTLAQTAHGAALCAADDGCVVFIADLAHCRSAHPGVWVQQVAVVCCAGAVCDGPGGRRHHRVQDQSWRGARIATRAAARHAAQLSDNSNQAKGMTLVTTAWGLGLVVGPALGG